MEMDNYSRYYLHNSFYYLHVFFWITANTFIEWLSLKTGLKTWLDKNGTGLLGFLFAFAALCYG